MILFEKFKPLAEKLLKIKIYRNSLPFGTDLFFDIARYSNKNDIKVLFDVGANVGQTALYFAKHFPSAHIYSFEPVKSTFQKLVENTKGFSNIRTFNYAVGRVKGKLEIGIENNSRNNSFLKNTNSDHELVEVINLENFTNEMHINKIDFLKIDTEGYDLEVLKGAGQVLSSNILKFIQIEVGFNASEIHVNFYEVMNYLQYFDFNFFGLYEQQPFWNGEPKLMFANAVFINSKFQPDELKK